MRKVVVTIDKDGNPTILTTGFSGAACKAATKSLQDELGMTIKDEDTAEMHMAVPATVKAGGGVR